VSKPKPQKFKPYTGPLATRVSPSSLLRGRGGILDPDCDIAALVSEEFERKWPLLFIHYGLDPLERNWFLLSLKLAVDHVPGFQKGGISGRPRNRGLWEHYARVRLIELEKRWSVARICDHLAKHEPKCKDPTKRAETLRRSYWTAKKAVGEMFKDAAAQRGITEAEVLGAFLKLSDRAK
jgi:hypothetical protein